MNKELIRLIEATHDYKYKRALHLSLIALEDKPDARVIDVLRHMMENCASIGEVADTLCHAANAQLLTLRELFDTIARMRIVYPGIMFPLDQYGDERTILRRYTSDEDVRLMIECSSEPLISRPVYNVYAVTYLLQLKAQAYRVTLVPKGLSFESILEVMLFESKTFKDISKSLCVDNASNEAQDYDVYAEVTSKGRRRYADKPYDATSTREPYRPLTQEEFEAVRLVLQITH